MVFRVILWIIGTICIVIALWIWISETQLKRISKRDQRILRQMIKRWYR